MILPILGDPPKRGASENRRTATGPSVAARLKGRNAEAIEHPCPSLAAATEGPVAVRSRCRVIDQEIALASSSVPVPPANHPHRDRTRRASQVPAPC